MSNKLVKKIEYTGYIKLKTGLHIGGTNSQLNIGGPDKFVVRNPINNIPYIPGSSIKGAIRTAVLSSVIKENDIERFNYDTIEKEKFGKTPNTDIFRTLKVGDAYFGDNYESAIKVVMINERERQGFDDRSKEQVMEVIQEEDTTTFSLNLDTGIIKRAAKDMPSLPDCMTSVEKLFSCINSHTNKLLNNEISWWEKRKDDSGSGSDMVDGYITNLRKLLLQKTSGRENGRSCVLRIGAGSGWRFITGDWSRRSREFKSMIVPKSRPNNSRYTQFDFPKTRRIIEYAEDEYSLLGFVELSMEDR